MRAIQEMNGRKPRGFEAEIVVKLARFDHAQSPHVLSKVAMAESNGNVLRGHSPSGQLFNGNVPRKHFAASFGAVGGGQQSSMGGGFMSTQRSPMALNGNNNGHFNVNGHVHSRSLQSAMRFTLVSPSEGSVTVPCICR